jgi:hypothetical protein
MGFPKRSVVPSTTDAREVNAMMKQLAQSFVILSALAALGFAPATALAESVKDTGGYDATYTKKDAQQIPDQEGHELVLNEATGTAASPGGPLDGFSVIERGIADLSQGNGPQQGYVIFDKGSDRQIVRYEGRVTTTMKDGQPNTTMKGTYEVVNATGALAGTKGKGTYSGYFTAEGKYHIDWDGMRTLRKDAMASPDKN